MNFSPIRQIRSAVVIGCLSLAGCGGGSTTGGGFALTGPTSHPGLWELLASITIITGGTSEDLEHTTTVNVAQTGAVGVQETDASCSVSVHVNGEVMTYREDCTVATENGPCVIELTTTARFFGESLSGNFGPRSFVCVGVPVSFSGNLVGKRPEITE